MVVADLDQSKSYTKQDQDKVNEVIRKVCNIVIEKNILTYFPTDDSRVPYVEKLCRELAGKADADEVPKGIV